MFLLNLYMYIYKFQNEVGIDKTTEIRNDGIIV